MTKNNIVKRQGGWRGLVRLLSLPALLAPLALFSLFSPLAQAAPALKLHRPSPDWRDQVLYFVLTDRFADGDPGNNDQGRGEYRPGQADWYNGGDLAGLRQRLDYIAGLGVTGVWITPPVANQWTEPGGQMAGYHGYWAEHFGRVDRHLGTLADYRRLSDALHCRGMVLVQDIVVNHTGNYFTYGQRWNPADPAQGWQAHDASAPVPRPSQPPFDSNDPRDPAQRARGVYHWTPDVVDYGDPVQERSFQMSGLDDLNTENPLVRRVLRQSYGHWLRAVGVDAFRVDTAFYVPPDFFDDFLNARDAAAPGLRRVARATGRRDLLVFGEGFAIDRPGQDAGLRKIAGYLEDAGGRGGLPGMLNFPLYGALGDVFARGAPPAELAARLRQLATLLPRRALLPTFIDNHDVDRFRAGASEAALRQALLALFTLPGIPVIYYGTEQGLTEQRASMFAAGWGSGGRDRYDSAAPLYRDIAAMAALRRSQRLFSRGQPTLLAAHAARAGALAWRTDHGRCRALVVFNTADTPTLLAALETGLPAGTRLRGAYGLHGLPSALQVGAGGRITLVLKPRSGQVWLVEPSRGQAAAPRTAAAVAALLPGPRIDPPSAVVSDDFDASGAAPPGRPWRLVLDGDIEAAQPLSLATDGRWRARIDTAAFTNPAVPHELALWDGAAMTALPRRFRVERPWRLLADVEDPAGDDHGPRADARYRYPDDPGWGANRQMDLRRVRVAGAGGALKLDISSARLTRSWNPSNGFDHVLFTVFIELPGEPGGATAMPLQNAELPDGMRWHRRLRVGGWSNALFSSAGADAVNEGRPLTPAAELAVDADSHTLTLTLSAAALGQRRSLSGARIFVTTWDYDGGYRRLSPEGGAWAIGGGAENDPKVMDASAVIVLP